MKRIYRYIIGITCSLAAVFSCVRFEEQDIQIEETQKVKMVFKATAEGPADTKAVLGGEMGDAIRQIVWAPGDEVGISESLWYNGFVRFTNIEPDASDVASPNRCLLAQFLWMSSDKREANQTVSLRPTHDR